MDTPTPIIPLPDQVSGLTGFVLAFAPIGQRAIRTATQNLPLDFEPLLDAGPPHCTLAHANIVNADSKGLFRTLDEIRTSIASSRSLQLDQVTVIAGRFLALKAEAPPAELQLAAIIAAFTLREWLDKDATPAATAEKLRLTRHQQWCLEEFGHPLVLPDVGGGQFRRTLHVSYGYKAEGDLVLHFTPVKCKVQPLIERVRLAKMGPRGVVEAYYNI